MLRWPEIPRGNLTTAFACVGVAAACAVGVKAAAVAWRRCELAFAPVYVRRFKWRWALVTGGSEGLGKSIAAALASQGLNIILVSRSQAKLDAAQHELQAKYADVQVRTVSCDVSKRQECERLVAHLQGTDIAVLVANAGGGVRGFGPYWEYSAAEETAVYDLNGTSTYALVRGLLPGMMERKGGAALVAISSLMCKNGAMAAPYGCEKAKLNAFMESLDIELQLTGHGDISAQAMVIGGTITPAILKRFVDPELAAASPAEMAAAVAAAEASKQVGQVGGMFMAPADAVGRAVVQAIGRGGPVVTPYWKHALAECLILDMWWPPSLQRAVKRACTRNLVSRLTGQQGSKQAA